MHFFDEKKLVCNKYLMVHASNHIVFTSLLFEGTGS
jgi:hypothetical protein